jgi:hypothetical protein
LPQPLISPSIRSSFAPSPDTGGAGAALLDVLKERFARYGGHLIGRRDRCKSPCGGAPPIAREDGRKRPYGSSSRWKKLEPLRRSTVDTATHPSA